MTALTYYGVCQNSKAPAVVEKSVKPAYKLKSYSKRSGKEKAAVNGQDRKYLSRRLIYRSVFNELREAKLSC